MTATFINPYRFATAVVLDSFDRADSALTLGNADTGQAWLAGSGTWGIASNLGYNVASGGDGGAVVDAGIANVIVRVTLATLSTQSGLIFRYVDEANLWRFIQSSGTFYLQRRVAGGNTTVAGFPTGTAVNGDRLKVIASGDSISVYQNDSLLGSTTDATHNTATKHGLHAFVSTAARFNDFSVAAA